MDLIPLPVNEPGSLVGKKKPELFKSLHEKVKVQIENKSKLVASQANKGRKGVIFEPGDWVWCTLGRSGFRSKGSPSCNQGAMVHFKLWKR